MTVPNRPAARTPLATLPEVLDWLGISRRQLRSLREAGDFPEPIYVTSRQPRWPWPVLEEWCRRRVGRRCK